MAHRSSRLLIASGGSDRGHDVETAIFGALVEPYESLLARLSFDAKLNLQGVATSLDPWRVFEDSTHYESEADLHPVHRVMERVPEEPWLVWSPRLR